MTHDKKKRQDLGIFYTREEIVNFVYNILILWKEKEDKEQNRWESHKPKHYPSVIDPACGEGIFLKKALEKKFTTPQYIWGIDIDEHAKDKWEKINLLKSFKSKAKLDIHFFHQNGLLPLNEKKILRYKKGGLKEFDAVVGNPPYGGVGLETEEFNDDLVVQLENYNIFPAEIKKEIVFKSKQDNLDIFDAGKSKIINQKIKDRLKSFPIEVLFIDRFIQLAKPEGWIAIIIPDGILSNSNLHYVRQYIADNAKVEAIVSLPRDAFKHVGTSAKTSILFLKKHSSSPPFQKGDSGGFNYPIFLASLDKLENGYLTEILSQYKEFYMKQTLSKDKKVYFNDFVMVRVDKTMRDLFAEKPSSRWDAGYWDTKYDHLASTVYKWRAQSLEEVEGKNCIISGDHVRPSRGESKGYELNTGIEYYETKNFLFTGYDYSKIKQCSKNAYERLKYTAVKQYDILISCAGVGGAGKGRSCLITHSPKEKSCTGDVFVIRLKKLNPFLVYVVLNSKIGKDQILRNQSGVGTVNINSEQALALNIPNLPNHIESRIESEYKKMAAFHDKAMEAKAKGDEAGYKKNIETAEAMLKDLIARTEAVIRGERADVV